jgi:hypothetical protein
MTIYVERETGRKYRLVKIYSETGNAMERSTLRRYSAVKRYV